jgi:hypothetical protein
MDGMDLDNETVRPRLAALLTHFAKVGDERDRWRVAYPLDEVLLLITCATICTCDDFEDIVEWGETHLAFLREFSEYHFGIPCTRWLRDILNRVDPVVFARCLDEWIAAFWPNKPDNIAIDGKTARRTHDRGKGRKALHTLSAYATNARLVLAQTSVPEKANEITAIPELLDQLAEAGQLKGALVTIDAMGCQYEIADTIVGHGADYNPDRQRQPADTGSRHHQLFRNSAGRRMRDTDNRREGAWTAGDTRLHGVASGGLADFPRKRCCQAEVLDGQDDHPGCFPGRE